MKLFRSLKRQLKSKRGISLAECVAALAVISVVSVSATTIILSATDSVRNNADIFRAKTFAENAYECFLAADSSERAFALLGAPAGEEGVCVSEQGRYTVTITLDYSGERDSFRAEAKKGEEVLFSYLYLKG